MENNWISADTPPSDDRMVEVKDAMGVTRLGYACYFPVDIKGGKIIQLDKPKHDGTWMIDETIPFTKAELNIFDTPEFWREIKQEGGE